MHYVNVGVLQGTKFKAQGTRHKLQGIRSEKKVQVHMIRLMIHD
jgi:hypothetical protein